MAVLRSAGLALAVAALACVGVAEGERASGHYRGSNSWAVAARFAFSGGQGRVDGEMLFPADSPPTLALFYPSRSEDALWESDESTCQERLRGAQTLVPLGKLGAGNITHENVDGKRMVRASYSVDVSFSEPSWLVVAMGSCEPECSGGFCSSGLDVRWAFDLTSGAGSMAHLGYPERGVLFSALVLLGLNCVFAALYLRRVTQTLAQQRKYHATVHLVVLSVACATLALLLRVLGLVRKASDGEPRRGLLTLSQALFLLAETALLLLGLLLAKGWTITCRKISAQGRMRIGMFLTLYLSLSVACVVYYYTLPPEASSFIFDSWPGYVLVALRVLGAVWFARAVSVTLAKYRKKRAFYAKMRVIFTFWLLSVPILAVFGRFVLDYNRDQVLLVVSFVALLVLQAGLTMLYDPNGLFVESFPFHTTVTAMRHRARQRGEIQQSAELNRLVTYSTRTLARFSLDLLDFLEQTSGGALDTEDIDLPKATSDRLRKPPPAARHPLPKHQNWVS